MWQGDGAGRPARVAKQIRHRDRWRHSSQFHKFLVVSKFADGSGPSKRIHHAPTPGTGQ